MEYTRVEVEKMYELYKKLEAKANGRYLCKYRVRDTIVDGGCTFLYTKGKFYHCGDWPCGCWIHECQFEPLPNGLKFTTIEEDSFDGVPNTETNVRYFVDQDIDSDDSDDSESSDDTEYIDFQMMINIKNLCIVYINI